MTTHKESKPPPTLGAEIEQAFDRVLHFAETDPATALEFARNARRKIADYLDDPEVAAADRDFRHAETELERVVAETERNR